MPISSHRSGRADWSPLTIVVLPLLDVPLMRMILPPRLTPSGSRTVVEVRDEAPDDPCQPRSGLGAGGQHLLVVQWLARVARSRVRDERYAADPQPAPAGGDALQHRRHPDRVGAERPQHPDLRRGLVLRPQQPGVDAVDELDTFGPARGEEPLSQLRIPGGGQVLEPWTDGVR